jgi:hypothetical protein
MKKKTDGNRSTDFAYGEELKHVQEKLRCADHAGQNRWCYISPENPKEHINLGVEEVTLWARKLVCFLVFFLLRKPNQPFY